MPYKNSTVEIKPLLTTHHFAIELMVKNDYTHYVQVTHLPSGHILQKIPFDPTDRTVAGFIDVEALRPLGDVSAFLKILSETLLTQLGAKEFMVISDKEALPNFKTPENAHFDRFRHYHRDRVLSKTAEILKKYKPLTTELDKQYHFVTDEQALLKNKTVQTRYQEVQHLLKQTRFTPNKMYEYKQEELQGKLSRFRNEYVRPIVMLDKQDKMVGMVRALLMGNQFAYLSDEVIDQNILPLDQFKGLSIAEKKAERELFLLAYLMQKACMLGLSDQKELIMIAARGREKMYDAMGAENASSHLADLNILINLSAPGPALTETQETIKLLPLPAEPNKYLQYGKYVGMSAALLGAGLFAYKLYQGNTSDPEINAFKLMQ